jgi:cbb3-type cytochrome oxidase subunit 3
MLLFLFIFAVLSGIFYFFSWWFYKPTNINNEEHEREAVFLKNDEEKDLLDGETTV